MKGGRPLAQVLASWKIIRIEEYDRADGWLKKHGLKVAFWSRLLPIVRTFISFPAGSARVDFRKFTLYTFLGSLPWCFALGYVGVYFGENWESIRESWRKFDLVVVVGILVLFGFWLWHHFRGERKAVEEAAEDRPAV